MPNTQSRWFEITRLSSQAEPRGTGRTRLGWRLPWQSNRGRFTPFQAKRCGFLGEVKCVNIAGAFEKKTETHCWSPQGFLLIELSNLLSLLSAGEQERGAAARNPPCVLGQTGWDLLFLAGCVGAAGPPRASLTCGDTTRLDTGPHKRWDTSTSAPPCSLCRDGVRLFMQERGCKISGSCPDTALSVSQGGTAGNCSVQASTHGFVRCDARERDKTLTKPHPFSQGLSSQGVTMQ